MPVHNTTPYVTYGTESAARPDPMLRPYGNSLLCDEAQLLKALSSFEYQFYNDSALLNIGSS